MTTVATQFVLDLKTALESITIANGYNTDMGNNVRRGFFAHVLRASDSVFPALVIHPGVEEMGSMKYGYDGATSKAMITYVVPLVVAVEMTVDDSAYDVLQACGYDIRKAIMRNAEVLTRENQPDSLDVGAFEPDVSRDSRFALAAMTVGVSFTETY